MPHYLVDLRERRKLTQDALADLSGVAQNTISKLERNQQARPMWDTVSQLAVALQVEPSELRFGPSPRVMRRRSRARRSIAANAVSEAQP